MTLTSHAAVNKLSETLNDGTDRDLTEKSGVREPNMSHVRKDMTHAPTRRKVMVVSRNLAKVRCPVVGS